MSGRPVPRLAAASGAASVVLMVAGNAIGGGGSTPDLTASRAKVAAWLADQHSSAAGYAGGVMELLGILALIVFAATLSTVLRRDEEESPVYATTVLGAGLVSAALKLASVPAAFAGLWRAKQGFDPQLAAALIDMNNVAFILTWAVDAVMLGAAAAVILRSALLPRWLGRLAAVTAAVSLASVPVATHVPPVGMLLTLVWLVAASVVLLRGRLSATPAAAAAAAAT